MLPTQVSSLAAWWKADSGCYKDAGTTLCSNGDTVYQWNDQVGSNHFVQTTAGSRPTYQTNIQNSRPGVYFAGDYMRWSGSFSPSTAEIMAVLKTDSASPGGLADGIWDWGSNSTGNNHYPWNGNGLGYDDFGSTTRHDAITFAVTITNAHILHTKSASSSWVMRQNTTSVKNDGTNTVGFVTNKDIGWSSLSSVYIYGHFFEILLFNAALTEAERVGMEWYLHGRWNITGFPYTNTNKSGSTAFSSGASGSEVFEPGILDVSKNGSVAGSATMDGSWYTEYPRAASNTLASGVSSARVLDMYPQGTVGFESSVSHWEDIYKVPFDWSTVNRNPAFETNMNRRAVYSPYDRANMPRARGPRYRR